MYEALPYLSHSPLVKKLMISSVLSNHSSPSINMNHWPRAAFTPVLRAAEKSPHQSKFMILSAYFWAISTVESVEPVSVTISSLGTASSSGLRELRHLSRVFSSFFTIRAIVRRMGCPPKRPLPPDCKGCACLYAFIRFIPFNLSVYNNYNIFQIYYRHGIINIKYFHG